MAVDAEGITFDSRGFEFLEKMSWQLVRTDLVKQKVHLHAGPGPGNERLLEASAHTVVFHDEKVYAQIDLGLVDRVKDPLEGHLPVD